MSMDKITIATDLAATLGTARTARAWLTEAAQNTADDLSARQALLAVSVALETRLPGATKRGTIEYAVARDKWQTAYDASMALPLGSAAALARLLLVAEGLYERGAADASLDLLGRAIDPYIGTPEMYRVLVDVLETLGRADDAEAARMLLREYAPQAELVAA
jgi:hypothetical protein